MLCGKGIQFPCILPKQNIVARPAGWFLSCREGMQFPCLLPRQNIVARNIVARPPGWTISLSTPKTKHCGEKHCGKTNFLVYSQDKTLRRETLWRDQFPCLLPRQNIAAKNIVARPPGCTIFLSTPKTKHCGEKHCGEKHCGETGWLVLVVWKGDTISLYTPKTKHCSETGWLVLVL